MAETSSFGGIFSILLDCNTGSFRASPEPAHWSELCTFLSKYLFTVGLHEFPEDHEVEGTNYPYATDVHAKLCQCKSSRFFRLPSVEHGEMCFFTLFLSINDSVANGVYYPPPKATLTKIAVTIGFMSTSYRHQAWNVLHNSCWLEMAHMDII